VATNHNVGQDGHIGASNPQISDLTVPTSINSGSMATVSATMTNWLVQNVKAQYKVTDSSNNVVIDWTAMSAGDGTFDGKTENIVGSIDTTGLSGTYTVYVKGMVSSYSGGHDPTKLYYPDNGGWTGTATVILNVSGIPTWASTWTNLGGATTITPDIAEFNGKLYSAVRGFSSTPGNIWIKSMDTSGTWTGYSAVPLTGFPGALVGAGPSIYAFNNRLYLLAAGSDNSVYINSFG
jgi:hypothetical protein